MLPQEDLARSFEVFINNIGLFQTWTENMRNFMTKDREESVSTIKL